MNATDERRSRSCDEAMSKCREAVRSIENGATEDERNEAMWTLYTAFTRLDIYLTGGASLPEPWKIAARLDMYRSTADARTHRRSPENGGEGA